MRRLSLRISAVALAVGGLTFMVSEMWWLALLLTALTVVLWLAIELPRGALKQLHTESVLLHLNQQFAVLQHSAQLLFQPVQSDSLLKTLQRERAEQALQSLLKDPQVQLLPVYPWQLAGLANLCVIVLIAGLILAPGYFNLKSGLTPEQTSFPDNSETLSQMSPGPAVIKGILVSISSPAYTGQADMQQTGLDISAVAGSTVTWQLTFSNPEQSYFLQLAGQPDMAFERQGNDFVLTLQVTRSGVYHISDKQGIIGSIHSIAVTADDAPKIRITEPTLTITTFAKTAQPAPVLSAQINDDFGIGKVDILASVAKGSGESVKFRDEIFQFDTIEREPGMWRVEKQWDFSQLDMEPGDEIYFTVRAWDNRTPEPQLSRSETKILRWLDDEEALAMGDGILIDFMPEYFKSQRQIIIETKQLIADRGILSDADFAATSRSLGQSQSDLKLKYGQYLGDEFDDGSGAHQMEDGVGTPHIDVKDGDHSDEDEHDDSPQVAAGNSALTHHEHSSEPESQDTDKTGYQQIIEQFGHSHGDTDIGVIGTLSPKALMKRAIAFMWDAELQLLLAEPELALPHEENALIYLNRARKAERIYIKRLGFEPPPVTEKRRYQGDLNDILSYQRYRDADPDDPYTSHLTHLLNALNQARQTIATEKHAELALDSDLSASIEFLKPAFIEQAQTRPAMVSHVATLEKMQLAGSLWVSDCGECMSRLYNELWQQLAPLAIPGQSNSGYRPVNPMVKAYSEHLLITDKEQP
ncbi:hypothetical protein BFC17_10395 [Alteromonas lipolytica]|uniref:DUF4175 domain-containing protein n=1 Tax=Alteromonas lipolytica TaxID=1856405 RepID=A0A1E8FJK9_9ALTE|nr:hypothetical protein BFC17_10395 [Alteromonas lipolytica]